MVGQGGLNGIIVDPILKAVAGATVSSEIPLNIVLIIVCLGLRVALLAVKEERIRPVLIVAIVVSVVIWWIAEGLGMIFTGMATDFNSGLLLVVMALACWPSASQQEIDDKEPVRESRRMDSSAQPV